MIRKIYRIEIWASDDNCEEYWRYFPISDFYTNKEDAEKRRDTYSNFSNRELEKLADVCSVRNHKPQVIEYNIFD